MYNLPASEARQRWSDLLDHAHREPVAITVRGREQVVVLEADLAHRALQALEDAIDRAAVDAVRRELEDDPQTLPLEDVARELGITLD
ncbi:MULTISPECIES: type II toxin-antitoxin system prevent-host-death family antitoxin [Curtobacterium]|jgi:prevent-host-death family protein|uniref:Antitoxin n=1 Tax=Curtobacterium citri TaxID=3055139 RepID=A0ABT7T1X8_9MICO|nr:MULTISPECIES: type II toxin-antitoxin system prevent-host-death family antitoxin [Curtobacterium]MDM7883584.1 type II toxin-antitoxin system prevent-host-death family antitoxin [Curtobacterium citri]